MSKSRPTSSRRGTGRTAKPSKAQVSRSKRASRANSNAAIHAGISDDAVTKRTGRTWVQWFRLIDAAGGRKMDHKSIAALLARDHSAPPWWGQMITVGYEQARGMRVPHQTAAGYSVSASRTLPVPLATLFGAWTSAGRRKQWLPGEPITIHRSTANKSIRARWKADDTHVEVNFYAKPAGKTQCAVQHSKLPDAKIAARQKKFWGERLDQLRKTLVAE